MRCPDLSELPPPPSGKTGFPWTAASARVPDEKNLPRISVVTPSYNQGKFLEETIRSVLLQGYPDLEYIVVDGGSTDDSVEIIRKYERWIASWVSEPDQGQADAINKGFARARGQIVAWLNSDDYYLPDVLGAVASRFVSGESPGLVFGEIFRLDASQSRILYKTGYAVAPDKMLEQVQIPFQPASFFNRTVLSAVGTLDVTLKYVMDADIILKIMANAGVDYVPAPLAVFRIHENSKTSTADDKFGEELLIVLDRILANRMRYPKLLAMNENKLRCGFYRLISKHFYMGNRFRESLRYTVLAVKAYPPSLFDIVRDEGLRWLIRRLMPASVYRSLSLLYRSKR